MSVEHREPRGHNRDYYRRPIQSDRLSPGYGNTRLTPSDQGHPRYGITIIVVLLGLSAIYALAVLS